MLIIKLDGECQRMGVEGINSFTDRIEGIKNEREMWLLTEKRETQTSFFGRACPLI